MYFLENKLFYYVICTVVICVSVTGDDKNKTKQVS